MGKITKLEIEMKNKTPESERGEINFDGCEFDKEYFACLLESMRDSNATQVKQTFESARNFGGHDLIIIIRSKDHFYGWRKLARKLVDKLGLV